MEENKKLKIENEDFKMRLGLALPLFGSEIHLMEEERDLSDPFNGSEQVTNSSSPQEKINLFISLFKGRDDVYARRWQNKEGKTGYSPVCLNEWVKGICSKPKIKCSDCENKHYAILDSTAIDSHLRGKAVFGVYPMQSDETCYFLAIDFDDNGWQKDINAVRDTCIEKNIPFAVERSQSGNGAHMWFFFKDQIKASTARFKRYEIKFSSYDRLFPNQDTLPKGGFGNLIALPLQSKARKSNDSVFIDENFQPYNDQWHFLSSICKMNEEEVDGYITQFGIGNELGELRQIEDEEAKPWEKKKADSKLNRSDIPNEIHITKANMLYIKKNGFSNKALNTLKRLAAFRNPDFYKAQAMRLPTFDKPRIISLSDEMPDYLCLPRGCEIDLTNLFEPLKGDIKWADETFSGKSIKVEFNGQLRDYVDVHVGVLERMYHKRLKGYASIGYSAKSDSKPFEATNAIFDNHNFMTVFSKDMSSAKSDIVIVSPYMTRKRLSQMLNILSSGINNGAKLTIITRPEADYKEKDRSAFFDMVNSIRLTGAKLIFKSNIHQKFAIIDQRIVWYGSINLLSFGRSEESMMRLDSINIANELIGTIEEML